MIDIKLILLRSHIWNHLTVCKENELKLIYKCFQQNTLQIVLSNI